MDNKNMTPARPGRPTVDHPKVMLSIRVPKWLRNWLKTQSRARFMSQSELVEDALVEHYDIERPDAECPTMSEDKKS